MTQSLIKGSSIGLAIVVGVPVIVGGILLAVCGGLAAVGGILAARAGVYVLSLAFELDN